LTDLRDAKTAEEVARTDGETGTLESRLRRSWDERSDKVEQM